MTIRKVDRFKAADEAGRVYQIDVWQSFGRYTTLSGASEVRGMSELRLADGSSVTDIGEGKYEVVQTGVILRRM